MENTTLVQAAESIKVVISPPGIDSPGLQNSPEDFEILVHSAEIHDLQKDEAPLLDDLQQAMLEGLLKEFYDIFAEPSGHTLVE